MNMALRTTRWDSADYLRTEEERAAYLAACVEEGADDAAFIAHAIGVVARSRGMSRLARETGLTREGLYKALSEGGNPSFGTVLKVLGAMGYRMSLAPEPQAGGKRDRASRQSATRPAAGAAKRVAVKRAAVKRGPAKRAEAKPARKKPERQQPRA
jgi:probable addiction module antidote protein